MENQVNNQPDCTVCIQVFGRNVHIEIEDETGSYEDAAKSLPKDALLFVHKISGLSRHRKSGPEVLSGESGLLSSLSFHISGDKIHLLTEDGAGTYETTLHPSPEDVARFRRMMADIREWVRIWSGMRNIMPEDMVYDRVSLVRRPLLQRYLKRLVRRPKLSDY